MFEVDYKDVTLHTEVRRLGKRTVLARFLDQMEEMWGFLESRGFRRNLRQVLVNRFCVFSSQM